MWCAPATFRSIGRVEFAVGSEVAAGVVVV